VAEVGDATSAEVPRFVPAEGSLAALVGTQFENGQPLPPELGGDREDPLGGGMILTPQVDSFAEQIGMRWFVDDGYANFVVSQRAADIEEEYQVIWSAISAWRLELGPDMVVTVGTNVCAAPRDTYDWQNGEFVAVTNREQNQALGAWTMTASGPTPYAELDTLICERFIP